MSSRRLMAAAWLAAAALNSAPALAAIKVLIVAGLGGDPQYEERFTQWSQKVATASLSACRLAVSVWRRA